MCNTSRVLSACHGMKKIHIVYILKKSPTKMPVAFHLLVISIYVYVKSGSTCKEGVMLRHHISTAAQNMDLLWILWFYCDITAVINKMSDQVEHQKIAINISIICYMLSHHWISILHTGPLSFNKDAFFCIGTYCMLLNKIFVDSEFGLLLCPFLVVFALKPHPLGVCLAGISSTCSN